MGGKSVECDVEELYKWIDKFTISRQKKNISRDFSDAVPLAEILKQLCPKLVELHNYTPRNSISQKLVNWQTLNRKVLSKLDITLSNTTMEQLSQSVPGVVEKVLFDVKEKIESKPPSEKPNQEVYFIEGLSDSASGSVIPLRQKDSTKTVDHKVMPVDTFKKMESELEEKSEAITILNNKVRHLESLLAIKDERINDLIKQLQQFSNKDSASSLTLIKGGPRFLNKLF